MEGSTRLTTLRYPGICAACGEAVPARARAFYDRVARKATCRSCGDPAAEDTAPETSVPRSPVGVPRPRVAPGTAGGSALREYERRVRRRETRIRSAHPVLGGLTLALSDEPQSTRAWASGARGEQVLARRLDRLTPDGVRVLHDRRIPRTRANIDHIAVGPAGVFVIDAKHYRGKTVRSAPEGGWGRRRVQKLVVGGRDRTRLVGGVHVQVQMVRERLAGADGGAVPVAGMLCFIGAEWPLLGGSFVIEDVHVLWPKKIRDHVLRDRALDQTAIDHWHRVLAGAFRAS